MDRIRNLYFILTTKRHTQYTYNVLQRRVSAITVAVESNNCYILPVCICSLKHPAVLYFSTLPHKRNDFPKERHCAYNECFYYFLFFFPHSYRAS